MTIGSNWPASLMKLKSTQSEKGRSCAPHGLVDAFRAGISGGELYSVSGLSPSLSTPGHGFRTYNQNVPADCLSELVCIVDPA
ncbi:hypothetical protein HBH56_130330 [Parastagonospora nodorum]|nr:hypothetical protein HBH56_130330 [Parastagonospora nodorum]KAH3931417.1 hypothetical protein HBH54_093170 [Parastagonospora nodorum]KAH3947215.1 hypothetical protein HBH53_120690 [Parastagonospora nodorum]KAH3970651.1 hypothetical protein HBH51_117010 [Parastagonospora nodorum]KAH3971717.1 hypothetical protein HBH52_159290 [Parastagonospora nodorum]